MEDARAATASEIELRKIALEEKRESNRASEADRAHALELERHRAAVVAPKLEMTNARVVALIALIPAIVGSLASLSVGYLAGYFSVQQQNSVNQGTFDLEKQRFSNALIDGALKEVTEKERALRLLFMLDIGIFDEKLNTQKLREIAQEEKERIEKGGGGESLLPRSIAPESNQAAAVFGSDLPAINVFKDTSTIQLLSDQGALSTRQGLALLLANLHYESNGFRTLEENANYSSARRLSELFPKTYPSEEDAKADVGHPDQVLNKIYAGRLGNSETGDGWRFRGRGYVMLTGRANYARVGQEIGVDLVANPDLASTPEVAVRVALTFMRSKSIDGKTALEWAALGDAVRVRRALTGGTFGLSETRQLQLQYLTAFDSPQFADHPLIKALPPE